MLKRNQKELSNSADLAALRAESFRALLPLVGLTAYVWLILCIWTVTGGYAMTFAWVGSGTLVVGVSLSCLLRQQQPRLAYSLFVWSAWAACASLVFTFSLPAFAYLFILPIIFASVLLGHRSILSTAGLALLFLAAMSRIRPSFTVEPVEQALPMIAIGLVAAVAWLASRNLYVALAWAWDGYERASRNEQVARDQQAELRRLLKALDEASYRLERANVALTLAREQAEESRRLKQAFAQNISHELRAPLSLIVGFADLMIKSPDYYGGQLPPLYLRDLGVLHRNASHLQQLLNDVLDLARIEAAHMSLAVEKVDPAAFLNDAANAVRSLVESRGLWLRVEAATNLPALWMDPTRIRQVLFNLVSNAVRFTECGGITMRAMRRNTVEEEITFVVQDTGVGIAPENLERVFDEFFHTHTATEQGHCGAGLGLTISRNFVQLHGGRIWVESELGQGAAFFFSLPIMQQQWNTPAVRAESPVLPSPVYAQSILLVVTRNPNAATLLTRHVRGCRTVIVQDLPQAEHAAQQLAPQCVVIDSALLAGLEATLDAPGDHTTASILQRLAQTWGVGQTPLLACPMSDHALEGLGSERINGYIPKPVTSECLLDVLRQCGEGIDKILIIDDDANFARLLGRMLEACSVRRYELMTAGNGREGLQMIEHFRPDLVLLDLGLPDLDGFQLIERIRSCWPALPIVVISGQESMDRLKTLHGAITIARANGIAAGELVQWVQHVVDSAIARPASAAPKAMSPP